MKDAVRNIFFGLLIVLSFPSNAETHRELMEQANQAYINERYYEAIELYEQILAMQWESPHLYYNLGNAYYQTGQHAKAILNYERSIRLSPNDEATRHNLRIVRAELQDRSEQMPQLFFLQWRDQLVRLLSVDGWATVIVVLVFLLAAGCAIFYVSPNRTARITIFAVGLFLFITLLISVYAVNRQHFLQYVRQEAIVMSPRVTARSAPGDRGMDVFVVYEGAKVEIKSALMDWYEVRLSDGNVGWVSREAVEII